MITKYVNTNTGASVGTQDGSTDTPGSSGTAAFATLDQAIDWIVANDATLSDDYTINCRGLNADTTNVNVAGITVGSFSLLIQANPNEADGFYDGNEVISSSHYRLSGTSGDILAVGVACTIRGLQVETSAGAFRCAIKHSGNSALLIDRCRVRNTGSTRTGIGNPGSANALDFTLTIQSCLIVGFGSFGIELVQNNFRTGHWELRNNTIYGDGSSIGIGLNFATSGTPTAHLENNAIGNCGASADFSVTGTGTATYANNATEGGANGTTGEVDIGTLTDAWTSPGTTAAADFTIKSTSSALYNSGVNPDPANDVRGVAFVTNDIGAFAFEDAGGGGSTAVPVFLHHYRQMNGN